MVDDKHNPDKPVGYIKLICGPMFAGKSTMLIQLLTAAKSQGARVVAIKDLQDTRYGDGMIVTHNGERMQASEVTMPTEVFRVVSDAEVVGIDEVHFFGARIVHVCKSLARAGTQVICAGVDLDHRGKMFDVIAALSKEADEIIRLTSTCVVCGQPATMTKRLVDSDDRIVVGGLGDYEPRCKMCFDRTAP